jgi:hypothetical protein
MYPLVLMISAKEISLPKTGAVHDLSTVRHLCEMVHPVVSRDRNEALKLVQHFNEQLRLEGWNLMEEEKIACGAYL